LKRISSLVLVLVLGGSVFAGNVWQGSGHICKMMMPMILNMAHMRGMKVVGRADSSSMAAPELETDSGAISCGMEQMSEMDIPDSESLSTDMAGLYTMSSCKVDAEAATELSNEQCCVTIPQETGPAGTTSNLRPSSSIAIIHPALTQPPVFLPIQGTRPFVTQAFLPNLQATYIRNLSFLI
jgi:hypothetical protein